MDRWEIDRTADETAVSMWRAVPEGPVGLRRADIDAIRADVAGSAPARRWRSWPSTTVSCWPRWKRCSGNATTCLRLNTELEETNRGVVALYTELSEELEATNRGVVALYAELDQRTTQVRAASEAKTRFLANVSHELRSPVTSIVGLTRLLRDPSSDPLTDDQAQQLELIDASAHSLLGLVNELLDLAKAESGRLEPRREPTDLQRIFTSLRGTSARHADQRRDDARRRRSGRRADRSTPTRSCSPRCCATCSTNGIKFTPSGTVRMTATDDGDGYVSLAVSDTGIGIPDERAGARVRGVPPGAQRATGHDDRDRARPAVRPATRRDPGRHHRARQHSGRGQHVHRTAAGRRRTGR